MPGRTRKPSSGPALTTRLRWSPSSTEAGSWTAAKPSSQVGNDQWHSIAAFLDLSARQLQIARCVFDGLDEASISRELAISSHTVHTHLDRLYKKLHINSRCELVVRVFLAYLSTQSPERDAKLDTTAPELPGP